MIEHPALGQRIVLRYAAHKLTGRRPPLHREAGEIAIIARGPGPRNIGVKLDMGGPIVVVPRGNVFPEPEPKKERQGELCWS